MRNTAGIYARISEDRKGEALGVDRQLSDGRDLAAQRGLIVAEEYSDNDLSALKGSRRPGYEALMSDVDARRITHVIVWQTSRLWRNRKERAEGIERLKAAQASVLSVKGLDLDLSTAAGRMMAGILGEFDTAESEVKSERVSRAARQRAEEGLNHGSRRCYGYTKDGMHLVPDEADDVRSAAEMLLAGASLASVVRDLNKRGRTTVRGMAWTSNTLRDNMLRARHAGLSVHRGEVVGVGKWPPILDVETHQALTALLTDPARRLSTGNRASYLLSGIAKCGKCGGSITSAGIKRSVPGEPAYRYIYRCRAGYCVGRRRDWVDDYVTSVVVERLSRDDARELLVDAEAPDVPALRREAMSLRVRLDVLADDLELDERTLQRRARALRDRIDEIEAAMKHTSRAPVLAELVTADDIQATWDGLTLERQRAVVQTLMEVTLHRAGTGRRIFNPETPCLCHTPPRHEVEIIWKT